MLIVHVTCVWACFMRRMRVVASVNHSMKLHHQVLVLGVGKQRHDMYARGSDDDLEAIRRGILLSF